MRVAWLIGGLLVLLVACDKTYPPSPQTAHASQPTEAEVEAKFFDLVLADEVLKHRVDITSVRLVSDGKAHYNDYMDGHSGVGHTWCLLVSAKQIGDSETVAERLVLMGTRKSKITEAKAHKAKEIASQWSKTGTFLVSVSYKVGSDWNADDPWRFTWSPSTNVC
jgi:hypothetical protein